MKKNPSAARVKRPLPRLSVSGFLLLAFVVMPLAAHAQGSSPFDSGMTAIQTLFTGTIAKVSSLIAIVIGGYSFAHGEPGAKKTLAGVAAGTRHCGADRERPDLALGRIALRAASIHSRRKHPRGAYARTHTNLLVACGRSIRPRRYHSQPRCRSLRYLPAPQRT